MDRCHLKGSHGDALQAVLCAAGYNLRWLLRTIVKKGLGLLLYLLQTSGLKGLFEQLAEIFGLNRLQDSDQRRMPPSCKFCRDDKLKVFICIIDWRHTPAASTTAVMATLKLSKGTITSGKPLKSDSSLSARLQNGYL